MNILTIGTTDIPGGAARIMQDIKTFSEKHGHTVTVFVADKKGSDPKTNIIKRKKWRKIVGFLLSSENWIDTDWILDTKEFKEADIIHCHNIHGRYFNLSTLQKMSQLKPVVWTLHDEWAITPHCAYTLEGTDMKYSLFSCPSLDAPPRLLWNNNRALAKRKLELYKKSKLNIVTPSQWLYERVVKTPLGQKNIYHIPNGIDTSLFVPIEKELARTKLNLPLDRYIVLFFANDARNNPWKGWEYAEKIIQQSNDTTLFLCVGNLSDYKNESNVEYRGEIKDKETTALYYSAADCLLFPSIAENFPLVILEAMSCGLPIVSFDVGGVKEVVRHFENGYIAKYRDTKELKDGLSWIKNISHENKEIMSKNSISKIKENFTTETMIHKYLDLYKKIL